MDTAHYKRKLSDVFQINAITVEKDYFMLTHKPFKSIKMISRGLFLNGEQYFHENELYRTIIDNRDNHQFHVVKGDNGSGKSHLIRWVKENYAQDVKDEAIIFISRMHSTLKGALQQIIHAEVIQNHETSHRLKKLIDANEHLDKKHLKNIILAHLSVAVQEDDDTEDGTKVIKLRRNKRNNLYDFLSGQETRDFLLRDNGPLDRIQKKLAPGVHNEVMSNIDPHFLPEDFQITSAQAQEFKRMKDISPRALRLIGSIQESTNADEQEEVEEFREELAKYLNQFLDKVVQECLSLRGEDLKNIFLLLRQELKKEGKHLTLFIEDITSFTGVDKDLVEVLIADHKEDDSLCRLISIVGITNGYYNTSLPGNIKDRITSHIEIDHVVIQNQDECAELAARYINAVYLDDAQIQKWKNNGYPSEELPVATIFKQHSWANFKIENELELSIFPFTKAALWNFYVNLETQTPRNFLQTVLLQYIQKYTIDGPSGNFPPSIDKVIVDFKKVPNWKDSSTDRVLTRKVSSDLKEQYETLFRIWGNGTMDEQVIDGKNTVGSLEDDVFEAFGLKSVSGIQGSTTVKETPKPKPMPAPTPTSDNQTVTIGPGKTDSTSGVKVVKDGGKLDRRLPEPVVETPAPPLESKVIVEETPTNPKLEEALREIEKWAKGDPLSNNWMIGDLLEIIREYIPWDLEGISTFIVKDFLTNNYVLIEGQPKSVKVEALKFQRSNELKYALEALANYKYEGNGNWNFANAHMSLLSLHTWLETIREDILSFLKKPFDYEGDNWKMEEYIIAAEFSTTALMNGFTGDEQTEEDIYLQLVKNKEKDKNDHHSRSWVSVINYLNLEHTDLCRRYFNKGQGSVKLVSRTFFYDAYEIIDTINRLKSRNFELKSDELPKGRTSSWYTSVNILMKLYSDGRLIQAIEEEVKQSTKFVQNFHAIMGDRIIKETITQTVEEMIGLLDYLKEMKEPFSPTPFVSLYQGDFHEQKIVEQIQVLERLTDQVPLMEQMIVLSNNPSIQLQPFYIVLENFSKLLEDKSAWMTSKITSTKQELSTYTGNPLNEVKQDLETIKEFVTELDERSVDHATK